MFKRSTQTGYAPLFKVYLLPEFGSRPLTDITPSRAQGFLSRVSKTEVSWYAVRNIRNLLSRILRTALEWGYVERNAVAGSKLPAKPLESKSRYLSPAEIRQLTRGIKEPYRSMVLFAVLPGLSRSEMFALRWEAVDFRRGVVEVREAVVEGHFDTPKTRNRVRRVPLSRAAAAVLAEHRGRSVRTGSKNLVFASCRGRPIRPDNVLKRVIHPACERLKIPGGMLTRVPAHPRHAAQRARGAGESGAGNPRSCRY